MTTTAWMIVWPLLGSLALTSFTVAGIVLFAVPSRAQKIAIGALAEFLSGF